MADAQPALAKCGDATRWLRLLEMAMVGPHWHIEAKAIVRRWLKEGEEKKRKRTDTGKDKGVRVESTATPQKELFKTGDHYLIVLE